MRRRWFLKLLGGAALAPVVGKAALNERTLEAVCEELRDDGIALNCISHPQPGAFIDVRSQPRDQIKSVLYDGVKRVFEVEYEKAPPLFSDDGVIWKGHVDLDLAKVQELRRDSSY